MGKEYPYLSEERLRYKYKCLQCGAYIKRGLSECYRCGSTFSKEDVDEMIRCYRANRKANWHHIIYFVILTAVLLAVSLGVWY